MAEGPFGAEGPVRFKGLKYKEYRADQQVQYYTYTVASHVILKTNQTNNTLEENILCLGGAEHTEVK